ncbi:hypothetical protein [Escherichia coli]|uniref:hypothetical protein n=1 Tax=Escherichia coli TaxID=562 RepID=UPI0039A10183
MKTASWWQKNHVPEKEAIVDNGANTAAAVHDGYRVKSDVAGCCSAGSETHNGISR